MTTLWAALQYRWHAWRARRNLRKWQDLLERADAAMHACNQHVDKAAQTIRRHDQQQEKP